MPQEKVKKIHRIYGCIAAVLIVALGIALMLSCLDIYRSAPTQPYSAEAVALRFQRIAVLVWVVVALVVGGILLGLALPLDEPRIKARRDEVETMNRLKAKAGQPEGCGCDARKEQNYRKVCKKITAGLCILLAVYPAIYYSNWHNFPIQDLNNHVVKAILVAMIPTAIALGLCFGCSLLCSKSIARETAIYKSMIAANKGSAPLPQAAPSQGKGLLIARCAVLAAAIVCIALGAFNGGVQDLLAKAIAICTECIGLG